jgi:release factor glutamine methyltransferase
VPPASILDLGTGSGAIALALAKLFPESAVTAVDKSEAALALARENAESTGLAGRVTFLVSDWFSALPPDRRFQLIVANPPYLSDEETAAAQPEVKVFEPAMALSAGRNGAMALEQIISGARARLEPGGLLACETGIAQHPQLLALAAGAGFVRTESRQDLTGRDRYVLAFV